MVLLIPFSFCRRRAYSRHWFMVQSKLVQPTANASSGFQPHPLTHSGRVFTLWRSLRAINPRKCCMILLDTAALNLIPGVSYTTKGMMAPPQAAVPQPLYKCMKQVHRFCAGTNCTVQHHLYVRTPIYHPILNNCTHQIIQNSIKEVC